MPERQAYYTNIYANARTQLLCIMSTRLPHMSAYVSIHSKGGIQLVSHGELGSCGHNYIGHNYIGHKYICHNSKGGVQLVSHRELVSCGRGHDLKNRSLTRTLRLTTDGGRARGGGVEWGVCVCVWVGG